MVAVFRKGTEPGFGAVVAAFRKGTEGAEGSPSCFGTDRWGPRVGELSRLRSWPGQGSSGLLLLGQG